VIDASVAAKWFLDEVLCEESRGMLHRGHSLHAPDFLLLEMGSVFLKRIRRGDITPDDADVARSMLRQLPVEYHGFTPFLDRAYEVAYLTGQSIYDSLYVALALLLDAQVITADRRLYEGLKNGLFRKHIVWIEDV
jgi:predicted nucleic acid-binding protein